LKHILIKVSNILASLIKAIPLLQLPIKPIAHKAALTALADYLAWIVSKNVKWAFFYFKNYTPIVVFESYPNKWIGNWESSNYLLVLS
jgi:hypothetical protein